MWRKLISLVFLCGLLFYPHPIDAQQLLSELKLPSEITDMEWSPDGAVLAVSTENKLILFDKNLGIITELEAHQGIVTSLDWHPDGTQVATTGDVDDGTIKIWDYDRDSSTFSLVRTINSEFDYPMATSWSPDGSSFVEMWVDLETSLPDELHALVGLRDAATWELEIPHKFNLSQPKPIIEWNGDGTKVIFVEEVQWTGVVTIVDVATLTFLDNLYRSSLVETAAVYQDVVAFSQPSYIVIDSIETGEVINAVDTGTYVYGLAFNPQGNKLVIVGTENIRIVETATLSTLSDLTVPFASYAFAEWHPTDDTLALGSRTGKLQLWDLSDLPSTTFQERLRYLLNELYQSMLRMREQVQ